MPAQSTDPGMLEIWTVYSHPLDYPDNFVARKFVVGPDYTGPTDEIFVGDTLAQVRGFLPAHLTCFARNPTDEPQIVETWI